MQGERNEPMHGGLRRIRCEHRRIQTAGLDVHPHARTNDECRREPDEQSGGCQQIKKRQGFDDDARDIRLRMQRTDAAHDRAKDDRRDHHANQRDESVSERLERRTVKRRKMPQGNTEPGADEHLNV